MKLPGYRRLFSEDFDAQYKGLLDRLSGALNSGVEVLYQALNNGLTFSDNMAATIGEFTIKVDANGNPVSTTSFKLNNTQKVIGLFPISISNLTQPGAYPPGGVTVSFSPNSDQMIITNVTGLTAGNQYRIRVIALN